VANILDILFFFFFFLPLLFKTTEGVVVGFFVCFLFENIRRISVRVLELHRGFILTKKGDINPQKIQRPPLAPWGGVFIFF
jgi:hypothetical protein